jgi:hypothetical protein
MMSESFANGRYEVKSLLSEGGIGDFGLALSLE